MSLKMLILYPWVLLYLCFVCHYPIIQNMETLTFIFSEFDLLLIELQGPMAMLCTLPTAKILSVKNVWAWVSMVSYLKKNKIKILKRKKSWEPFRICLLNSTANPAQFGWKLAGLAVLFSRQILNGSQDLFFSLTL